MIDIKRISGVAFMLPLFLVITLVSGLSMCRAWSESADVPAPSNGEIVFHADVVTFIHDREHNVEVISAVVPNDQIVFLETDDGRLEGKLRFRVTLRDSLGEAAGESEKEVTVATGSIDDASDRGIIQVLQSKIIVPPGVYVAQIVLEDLNARKKEIVSFIRGDYKSGYIEAVVESQSFPVGAISLSDVEFARSLRRVYEGSFHKSGFEVIPNPHRRYGLLLAELPIYFEVYDLREEQLDDTLQVHYSIINKSGHEIYGTENPIDLRGNVVGSTALFSITSLPAGSYLLSLSLVGRDGDVLAESRRKFDVAWSVYSWGRHEIEALGDLAYIFTNEEMETFKSLSQGEQEGYLRSIWLEIDPTPGTVENEALIEHFRRVKYADQNYTSAKNRGALSDRGRLYIKYGPPDDVQSHYSDYEFVKNTTDIRGGSEPVPTDPFSRVGLKTGSSDEGSWDQAVSGDDAFSEQTGGTTVHGKAYEIWTYDGPGEPVRDLPDRLARSAKMRFVLVDERGFGEYRIVYSTEKHEY
ncbi:GWxTD domain-containing protein [Candidatus Eisenbacteria bacterium]|uniref:GWxTD domain-containing protein n=1 Tax=Eiseniibacteriota bacterium TaxID=2212470 RepID=A0ABV6YPM9_UNCEI